MDEWSMYRTLLFIRFLFPSSPIAKGSKIGVHPTKWPQNEKFGGGAFVGGVRSLQSLLTWPSLA